MDSGVTNGARSTHAWMQAYVPGAGWIDFDPANSIVGNTQLINKVYFPRLAIQLAAVLATLA